jgi:hypothetical protein
MVNTDNRPRKNISNKSRLSVWNRCPSVNLPVHLSAVICIVAISGNQLGAELQQNRRPSRAMVLFTLQWDQLLSPELSTDVVCSKGGVFGPPVECANTTLAPGQWSYGFVVNYTETVMLGPSTEFLITLSIMCMFC